MEKPARSSPQPTTSVTVRPMRESDIPELLRLMRAIVSFERGLKFSLNEAELFRRGFGERPEFGAYVADAGSGALAGMAVHYEIPFMHTLQPVLMLKWLYVDPERRGGRLGQRLMQQMAMHARAKGYESFCWFVLNDNVSAESFYRGLGGTVDPEWQRWVMPFNALNRLVEGTE